MWSSYRLGGKGRIIKRYSLPYLSKIASRNSKLIITAVDWVEPTVSRKKLTSTLVQRVWISLPSIDKKEDQGILFLVNQPWFLATASAAPAMATGEATVDGAAARRATEWIAATNMGSSEWTARALGRTTVHPATIHKAFRTAECLTPRGIGAIVSDSPLFTLDSAGHGDMIIRGSLGSLSKGRSLKAMVEDWRCSVFCWSRVKRGRMRDMCRSVRHWI